MEEMKVRLEKLKSMRVAHVHVFSGTPEEDAKRKLMGWAEHNGAVRKGARLFGRNTYPTDNMEPHGYEFFLTIAQDVKTEGDIDVKEITGGPMLFSSSQTWKRLGKLGRSFGNGSKKASVNKWVSGRRNKAGSTATRNILTGRKTSRPTIGFSTFGSN